MVLVDRVQIQQEAGGNPMESRAQGERAAPLGLLEFAAPVGARPPGKRSAPITIPTQAARAPTRRFWLVSALRAHTKAPYKTDSHGEGAEGA